MSIATTERIEMTHADPPPVTAPFHVPTPPNPFAARCDAHHRARILRDAAERADHYSVRSATILDRAAARQEDIGNGQAIDGRNRLRPMRHWLRMFRHYHMMAKP